MGRSYYPDFDVLAEQEAWDEYSRSVVLARTKQAPAPQVLSAHEVDTLAAVLSHLLYEQREELLAFVVSHFDQRMQSKIGESQRKPGVPAEAQLIKAGLAALDAVANRRHGQDFAECDALGQFQIVAALQNGGVAGVPELESLPQKDLFKKILGTAIDAYGSHPVVWSEMGYAGPAYPRGYYRIQSGLRDPWEPPKAEAPAPADPEERGSE